MDPVTPPGASPLMQSSVRRTPEGLGLVTPLTTGYRSAMGLTLTPLTPVSKTPLFQGPAPTPMAACAGTTTGPLHMSAMEALAATEFVDPDLVNIDLGFGFVGRVTRSMAAAIKRAGRREREPRVACPRPRRIAVEIEPEPEAAAPRPPSRRPSQAAAAARPRASCPASQLAEARDALEAAARKLEQEQVSCLNEQRESRRPCWPPSRPARGRRRQEQRATEAEQARIEAERLRLAAEAEAQQAAQAQAQARLEAGRLAERRAAQEYEERERARQEAQRVEAERVKAEARRVAQVNMPDALKVATHGRILATRVQAERRAQEALDAATVTRGLQQERELAASRQAASEALQTLLDADRAQARAATASSWAGLAPPGGRRAGRARGGLWAHGTGRGGSAG
ncbi:hypothetical protein PAPYR_13415 [Paratrimastix pyriformis]|uniref:Uncharacterized protein n=1 Tax=Paratrimastix pyriformis TaxID=342808 RepID=A0ABQ8U0C1_9EUKA|nr:hypothetical protein PAPYR_13415 [Paratrimastix pyriformis]